MVGSRLNDLIHPFPSENGPLRQEDAVSTVPNFRGDWVLFHPVYSSAELKSVEVIIVINQLTARLGWQFLPQILHEKPKTISDNLAYGLVRLSRTLFDLVSGYRHKEIPKDKQMSLEELRKGRYIHDDKEWMLVSALLWQWVSNDPSWSAFPLPWKHCRCTRNGGRNASPPSKSSAYGARFI